MCCNLFASWKKAGVLLCLWAVCFLLASCSSPQNADNAVTLWTFMDAEYPTLRQICDDFERENPGIKVITLKVPHKDLRDKYFVAAPAGVGPDLMIAPHDFIGTLQTTGMIAPIAQDYDFSDFVTVAQKAASYDHQMYMVPLCMDTLALFRNRKIMPERPKTLEDLIEKAVEIQRNQKDEQGRYINGFYYEVKEGYFSMPFLSAYGGYLIGEKNGVYDPTDIGLGNAGAIKGAEFIRALCDEKQYGLIKPGSQESISKSLFYDNSAAVIINGPWILSELRNRNNDPHKKHIDYAVDPFPPTRDGHELRSIVGLQGLMLNNYSHKKDLAMKLIRYISAPEQMLAISKSSGRPPVTNATLAQIQDNRDIATFADVCLNGFPMPSHPACQTIWEPLKQTLEMVSKGDVQAAEEMPRANQRIIEKIQIMME